MEINKSLALDLLEQVVQARGDDFIYHQFTNPDVYRSEEDVPLGSGCWYQYQGAPSCGVGEALSLAGVPNEVLREMDDDEDDTSLYAVTRVLENAGVHLTQDAVAVFTRFQELQDLEETWGASLEAAKEI